MTLKKNKIGILLGLFALVTAICLYGLARSQSHPRANIRLVDVAGSGGLSYRWAIAGQRPLDILQTMGCGCAFLDYDGDGDLDALLVGKDRVALFKGDGRGHFTDVSHQTGLDALRGDFRGVAVGDYDNDGYDDLYISGYHTGLLLHNEGGKRFRDVTAPSGLRPQPWGTSAAWADINGSGRLSLYVSNYIYFDGRTGPTLCTINGVTTSCAPSQYRAAFGVLYENLGGGKFRDATSNRGLDYSTGYTLAAAFADYDGSGHQSLYLANDKVAGNLFHNDGRTFTDEGPQSGTDYTAGRAHAGMGADWGDYDNDGKLDLVVGTFAHEIKPIYHNDGGGAFTESAQRLGLGDDRTLGSLTFGAKWLDFDNDGWLDLILANGHVNDNVSDYEPEESYRQTMQLFHDEHGKRFTDISELSGSGLGRKIVGRGLATGDFDNDGRVDVLAVDGEGAPLLLHNESEGAGHWLEFSLIGTQSNRDGYGATVTVTAGALTQVRLCHSDGSYLSSSDKRVHVGLGTAVHADRVSVNWPSGHMDVFESVPADEIVTLREGSPHVMTPRPPAEGASASALSRKGT